MYAPLPLLALTAAQSAEDGLALSDLIAGIPHDPAAIFTYVLLVAGTAGIFWIGRSRPPTVPPDVPNVEP